MKKKFRRMPFSALISRWNYKARYTWWLFKRQAGNAGCLWIHHMLLNRWMMFIGTQNKHKCSVCGREW